MQETTSAVTRRITYDDAVVRGFVWASVAWGAVGLLVGLIIALQLSFPQLNLDTSFTTFGRLRPLHTNAVIFALVGNMMFAGIYYSDAAPAEDADGVRPAESSVHLWGWQLIIRRRGDHPAAGDHPVKGVRRTGVVPRCIAVVALVWVAFAVNFFWTLAIRNEKNLYVSIWFYISTILTIAVLYIVNNLSLPVTGTKSYGVFSGAQDALTQWWYGHNAVAFFLTTPILGIMYYFLPKAADRPVFSYRLSIVHFWALVFIYIWAGPHHLLNTALPDWAQSLGMLFSLMLWAPSWGGMLNGLLTLRGAWHKVRTDPVLKFFVAGVTFYGMATFEGPLLSIKSVSALGHYTDWIIGHVHSGALGWNGFMAAGMFYWLVPKLFGTKLHSTKMADWHFWLGMMGILLYVASMWVSGISAGPDVARRDHRWRPAIPRAWNPIINSQQLMYLGPQHRRWPVRRRLADDVLQPHRHGDEGSSPVNVETDVTVHRNASRSPATPSTTGPAVQPSGHPVRAGHDRRDDVRDARTSAWPCSGLILSACGGRVRSRHAVQLDSAKVQALVGTIRIESRPLAFSAC